MGEKKIKFCDNCKKEIDDKIYYKAVINRIDDEVKKSGKVLDGDYCETCFWELMDNIKNNSDLIADINNIIEGE